MHHLGNLGKFSSTVTSSLGKGGGGVMVEGIRATFNGLKFHRLILLFCTIFCVRVSKMRTYINTKYVVLCR